MKTIPEYIPLDRCQENIFTSIKYILNYIELVINIGGYMKDFLSTPLVLQ